MDPAVIDVRIFEANVVKYEKRPHYLIYRWISVSTASSSSSLSVSVSTLTAWYNYIILQMSSVPLFNYGLKIRPLRMMKYSVYQL